MADFLWFVLGIVLIVKLFDCLQVVQIVAAFAQIFAFAQIVDGGQTLSRIALGLDEDLLDFRIRRRDEQFGTVETNTTQNFNNFGQKAAMKHWLAQFKMTKMTGTCGLEWRPISGCRLGEGASKTKQNETPTFGHVAGARLTSRCTIDHTLSRIHETAQLRSAILVDLAVLDAAFGDAHTLNLFRPENAELDAFDLPQRGLAVRCDDC